MPKPARGEVYAVTAGTYEGELYVCIDIADDIIGVLILPEMVSTFVPRDEFVVGMNKNILELQEALPVGIMNVCINQHNKNKNEKSLHRR